MLGENRFLFGHIRLRPRDVGREANALAVFIFSQGAESAPGAGEDTGCAVEEIAREPRGCARARYGFPCLARVGRFEDAVGELVAAVAVEEADLVVDEAHLVE